MGSQRQGRDTEESCRPDVTGPNLWRRELKGPHCAQQERDTRQEQSLEDKLFLGTEKTNCDGDRIGDGILCLPWQD